MDLHEGDDYDEDDDRRIVIDLQSRYQIAKEQTMQMRRELQKKRQELANLSNRYESQVMTLKDELALSSKHSQQLEDKLESVKGEMIVQAQVVENLGDQNDRLSRMNKQLKADNQNMEAENKKLKKQRNLFGTKLDEVKAKIDDLNEKIAAKDRVIQEAQAQRRLLQNNYNDLKIQHQLLGKSYQEALQSIEEFETSAQNSLRQKLGFSDERAKMGVKIQELMGLKTGLEERIADLEQDNLDLKEKLADCTKQLEMRSADINDQQQEIEGAMLECKATMVKMGQNLQNMKMVKQTRDKVNRDILASFDYLQKVVNMYKR